MTAFMGNNTAGETAMILSHCSEASLSWIPYHSTLACAVTGFTRHKVKLATNTVLPAEHLSLV